MDQSEIMARLTKVFIQVLGQEDLVLSSSTTADQVEGWDSFNHVNIIVGTEAEFGVKFNVSELESLRNVGDLAGLVGRRLASKK